ncbi:hypothetical protein NZK32_09070 [Cyanobium sp. FGCU-52]|nr:hypothetical protein [Cyanobium sp. FGCU52]
MLPPAAMPAQPPAWRSLPLPAVLAAALLILLLSWAGPVRADTTAAAAAFRCDGDPLSARLVPGAMDEPGIPDPTSGPVPVGGFVVLQWRDLSLQLPRTNNAGPASFTDGKWWWSLEDPAHPRFRLRRSRGDVQDFACEAAT